MDELRLILNQKIWIRRLKQEVLKQLPAKIRKMVYLKIPELKSEKKKQNKNFMDQFANIENLSAGIGFIILDQSNHSITDIRGHLTGSKKVMWGQKSKIRPNSNDMHIIRLEIFSRVHFFTSRGHPRSSYGVKKGHLGSKISNMAKYA